jgi:CRP/FNR family transcriptional regulator
LSKAVKRLIFFSFIDSPVNNNHDRQKCFSGESRLNKSAVLGRTPLFEGLPEKRLNELSAISIEKRFAKGELVFSEGSPANGFYIVAAGRIKIYKISAEGKEQILHLFGPGEPFGEVPVFEGRRFPAHAVAMEDSSFLFIPRPEFIRLITDNPLLALNMLAVLSRRLRRFTMLVDDLSLKEVPGRLATHLLYLSREKGGTDKVELDIPKSQLAGMLGTIPETLSRILAKMTKQGLISADGSIILIRDRPGLDALADGSKRL